MDAVAETIQERRNTLIETQEMIAILTLVIVAVFVIVVGFDCIKDGMCDIGAVIHDIIDITDRKSSWNRWNGNGRITWRRTGQKWSGI